MLKNVDKMGINILNLFAFHRGKWSKMLFLPMVIQVH